MRVQKPKSSFVVCVRDDGAEDLEQRKLYQVVPDREAAREGYLRVVDESGEDYLYPSDLFLPVKLPAAIVRRFMSSSRPARRSSARVQLRTAR
jgi:hypothetical protein